MTSADAVAAKGDDVSTDQPGGDFVHLHVHTQYSMLDSVAVTNELFAEVNRLGQRAVAMTDHGHLAGAFDFWTQAIMAGVEPIVGLEAFLSPGALLGADDAEPTTTDVGPMASAKRRERHHLTLWARDNHGMRNLFRISSTPAPEPDGAWGGADLALLEACRDGVIGTTGCSHGPVADLLRVGRWAEAVRAAGALREVLGPDSCYVEVDDPQGPVTPELLRLARAIGAPVVATSDVHYVRREDARLREALRGVKPGPGPVPHRCELTGIGHHLRSAAQMRASWAEHPQACDNTLAIAEQCDVSFDVAARHLPHAVVPAGFDEDAWFARRVRTGMDRRFPGGVPTTARLRAEREVTAIVEAGMAGYFLVLADLVEWARSRGIRVGPGRAATPSSLVAYALAITQVDPLRHGLQFERFFNVDRLAALDVDLDVDERRRGELVEHLVATYGPERVGRFTSFSTLRPAEALFRTWSLVDRTNVAAVAAKLVPRGGPMQPGSLRAMFDPDHPAHEESKELRELYRIEPRARRAVDLAMRIELIPTGFGQHSFGVALTGVPLVDVVPTLQLDPGEPAMTQLDHRSCEELGVTKLDLLGLRMLSVFSDVVDRVAAGGGEVVLEELELDDPVTFASLRSGDVPWRWGFEDKFLAAWLRQLRPVCFDDLVAVVALWRPRAREGGLDLDYLSARNGGPAPAPWPAAVRHVVDPILAESFGMVIYQEQLSEILQRLVGLSPNRADQVRRDITRARPTALAERRAEVEGAIVDRGFDRDVAEQVWTRLTGHVHGTFNKSHAVAYALMGYWAAYLEAHFPQEFAEALADAHERPSSATGRR